MAAGKRLRVHHLRGSSALAYEADVVLLMNDKYDVVARHHLVYDVGNAERFRNWAVMTIEKNRGGMTGSTWSSASASSRPGSSAGQHGRGAARRRARVRST